MNYSGGLRPLVRVTVALAGILFGPDGHVDAAPETSGSRRGQAVTLSSSAGSPRLGSGFSGPSSAEADVLVINSNGGWCWFEDPRVIVDEANQLLLVGTVKSPQGDIDLTITELRTGKSEVVTLDPAYQSDDHNSPAILKMGEGHYLAMWCPHGPGGGINKDDVRAIRWRVSEKPEDPRKWGPLNTWKCSRGVTYSNLFQMPDGTVLDFFRGNGFDPNFLVSRDSGRTFTYGGHLLKWARKDDPENKHGRPYVRYAQDKGRIHLLTTEDHPRDFDNSIYHGYLENGKLHHSDGREIGPVDTGGSATIQPDHLTRVFAGDARNVGWTVDLEIDGEGHPYAAFSVQKDDHDKPRDKSGDGRSGWDLRYFYTKWSGERWEVFPLAYAGSRLFAQEADYSGLVALHPHDPDVVYISTNADPVTGKPLLSSADNQRHYEIFEGLTADGGATWTWRPITQNSSVDNLRPIVPKWNSDRTALLWLRGKFPSFRDYRLEVVLRLLPRVTKDTAAFH